MEQRFNPAIERLIVQIVGVMSQERNIQNNPMRDKARQEERLTELGQRQSKLRGELESTCLVCRENQTLVADEIERRSHGRKNRDKR